MHFLTSRFLRTALLSTTLFCHYLHAEWSLPVQLSGMIALSAAPVLGMDGSGNTLAIWAEQSMINIPSIYAETLPFKGNWNALTIMPSPPHL